jgi:hypothetical protein
MDLECNDRQDIIEVIASETGSAAPEQALTPEQLLVAAGILAGLLDVDSIIVGKGGRFDVLLTNTNKGKNKIQSIL